MIFHVLDSTIKFAVYFFVVYGLWNIFSDDIIYFNKRKASQSRFRSELTKREKKEKDPLQEHIEMLIAVSMNRKSNTVYYTFLTVSFSMFFSSMTILSRQKNLLTAILISAVVGLIPYIWLHVKLSAIRLEGSYEGEKVVAELINQYKINYLNITEAIDHSIPFLDGCPHFKKIMARLSLAVKDYKSESELENIIDEFTFASNTDWAKMLANSLYLAISDGTNIQESLEDLLKQLRDAKKDLEENNRLNNETFVIIQVVIPGLYLASIYTAVKHFGFSIEKFIGYQVFTPIGLKMVMIIASLTVFNFMMMMFMKKKKFDF